MISDSVTCDDTHHFRVFHRSPSQSNVAHTSEPEPSMRQLNFHCLYRTRSNSAARRMWYSGGGEYSNRSSIVHVLCKSWQAKSDRVRFNAKVEVTLSIGTANVSARQKANRVRFNAKVEVTLFYGTGNGGRRDLNPHCNPFGMRL